MRHIILKSGWRYSEEPFPAFRVEMSYGRNRHSRDFIAVSGVKPDDDGLLPEGQFRLARSKKDGSVLVIAGQDKSDRCLLFAGASGGFRGDVTLFDEVTTGKLLSVCSAGNACESGIEVAVLLSVGESLAFHSTGRRTNQVEVHTWTGNELDSRVWSKRDWDRRNDPVRSEDNIDWLPGNFRICQLSGDKVSEGVSLDENAQLARHLFNRKGLLAHGLNASAGQEITEARFGYDMHRELVIAPANGPVEEDRVAVLAHEYSPGSGAKRWPSFEIDWNNSGSVEKLETVSRSKGSGSDCWTLVVAPVGWAENIAGQFVNRRDYGDQLIAYRPADDIGRNSLQKDLAEGVNCAMAKALQKAGLQ